MPDFLRHLRDLVQDTSANVMVLTALSMLAIAGGAGVATDTVQWTLWQRQMQRAADSAAYAAAMVKAQGGNATTTATSEVARYNLSGLATPVIDLAPVGHTTGVRVALSKTQALPFSSLFMVTAPTIRAEATADVVSFGDDCVRALKKDAGTGINVSGSVTLNLNCGLHSNAQGSKSVDTGGSSTITASPVSAVGGINGTSNFTSGTAFQPYSLSQPDPYAVGGSKALPDVVMPSPCNLQATEKKNGLTTFDPGCYKNGIDLKGDVKFNPGVYYVDGDFKIGSTATVSGTGVTFILTSSQADTNPSSVGVFNVNGTPKVNLSAPTTVGDTYRGVLFYQDRRGTSSVGKSNLINGNSNSSYSGAFYFPSQDLNYNGNAGMDTTCLYLVASTVNFVGNATLDNVCDAYGTSHALSGLLVRLVG
jgi:hypothetical protein